MRCPARVPIIGIGLLIFSLCASPSNAAWPDTGLPVCDATENQIQVSGCSDGAGGMILVWKDQRVIDYGIYVQRISVTGETLWTSNGVRVSGSFHSTWYPAVAPDGSGGAWVVWEDRNNLYGDIVLQHVSAAGVPDGEVTIRTGTSWFSPRRPTCEADGDGGVIVAFTEEIGGDVDQVVAQRFDADGDPMWTTPAVLVGSSIEIGGFIDIDAHHPVGTGVLLGYVRDSGVGVLQWVDASGVSQWNGTTGFTVGIVVPGSRVKIARRERAESGGHILYQRIHNFAGTDYREWMVKAIADNQFERYWNSVGEHEDTPPDANIHHAENGGCVVGWYYINPSTDEIQVYGKRFEDDGAVAWEQYLGRGPPVLSGAAPAVAWSNVYFGYRFVWPMMHEGTPTLFFRTMGRDPGFVIPDPAAGPLTGTVSSVTPVLVVHSEFKAQVFVGWRDERTITETDVYANLFNQSGNIPRANLRVRSFRADPNPNEVENSTHIRAVVENVGSLAAGSFSGGFWRDTATPIGLPDWEAADSDGLALGDSTVFDFDDTVAASVPTTWTNWFRADSGDDVDESSEADNSRSLSLVWSATADLDITAFAVSESSPSLGDVITYDITVENVGHVDAGAFEVHLYLDRAVAPVAGEVGDQVLLVPHLLAGTSTVLHSIGVTSAVIDLWNSYAYADVTEVVTEWREDNNVSGMRSVEWSYPENPGWPVSAGTGMLSSPVIASLPTIPRGMRAVVVTSSDGWAYAWDGQGDVLAGWPFDTKSSNLSSAAVGDLDADGVPEVLFGAEDGRVYCVGADGSSVWTYDTGSVVSATPALFDLINGVPSTLEVVVADAAGNVHILDASGHLLPGWPVDAGGAVVASPAVGDLDGAGSPEIVVVAGVKGGGSSIHVFTPTGSSIGGRWPLVLPDVITSSPALGDVLGDADLEIVTGDQAGALRAWVVDGGSPDLLAPLGAPVRGAISLARFNAVDTKLTMFAATEVYVSTPPIGGHWESVLWSVTGAGTTPLGWPVAISHASQDSRAGDGPIVWDEGKRIRVAIGAETGESFVFTGNGSRAAGTGMTTVGAIQGSLAASDIDGDLHLEVLVAGRGVVHCYDLLENSYQPHLLQWAQLGHDAQRTRCFGIGVTTGVGDDGTPSGIARTRLLAPHPNPFNPRVTLPFEVSQAGLVSLRIYDLAGRRVADLGTTHWPAGRHELKWDGTDASGGRVASGVYLVELRAADTRDRARVVLLK